MILPAPPPSRMGGGVGLGSVGDTDSPGMEVSGMHVSLLPSQPRPRQNTHYFCALLDRGTHDPTAVAVYRWGGGPGRQAVV